MIYTLGETVFDIIFKSFDNVIIKPGGSMLNTAISLGRLAVNVSHISKISTDRPSDLLIEFLQKNNVKTNLIFRNKKIKTNLALAYLNEHNNAEYTFYKDNLVLDQPLIFPKLKNGDTVHFGSFFSINPNTHIPLHKFLNEKVNKNCTIIYDPNFRKPHLPELNSLLPFIEKNFKVSDIVKASNEDFENIFGILSGKEAWVKMKAYGVKVLFYTKGEQGSEFYSSRGSFSVSAAKIRVVSTIGAGDTYSAGIIYFLENILKKKDLDNIDLISWRECVSMAQNFASETCKSMDNYLSQTFCSDYKYV